MAKSYTTIPSVAAGQVYTASAHNDIATTVNNVVVPAIVRLERKTTQSIANSTNTFVTWPDEIIDNDGCYTATSDTITIQTAGVYQINVCIFFASNSSGDRTVRIAKNPSDAEDSAARIAQAQVDASSGSDNVSVSTLAEFAVNDVVKVIVFQNSGGALNIADANPVTNITLAWMGLVS